MTDAEKTGYLFKGFYKDINCETQQVSEILATETQNITLYIKWQAITYQVEYNKNNATSSELMTNSTHTYDVDKELSENIYERVFTVTYIFNYAGKESEEVKAVATFNGWAETASGVKKYNDKQTIKNLTSINEDVVTLYANFTDAKITLLSPTRDSHNFTGWKLNDSTTYNANQQITPSEDITLTAQWEIKTYSITYYGNENDAGTVPSVQVKNYDEDIIISGCGDLSKIGHKFMAWNTKADGKGTTYEVGANYALNADLQLFAIWNAQVYDIVYKDQGGDDFSGEHSGVQPTTHAFGSLTKLISASKNGYAFKGWFNNSDCTGTSLTTLGPTDYTSDITLYAKFDAQVYDIVYKDQGGNAFSGTHESGYPIKHTFGTDTALKTASKTGYDFKGWYLTSACTGNEVGTLLAGGYTADITLYAKWDIQSYTITLEKGEGISSVGGAGTYNYGASVTISADLALGYSWKEWQQNDATYQVLQTFNFIIGTENVTFKAIATLNTYNITYDLAGGELDGKNPATYTVKDEFTLINPTRIGYTFAGWTYGDVSTPVVEMKISPNTIAENLDFVANWNPNTDTIYRIHYYLENLNNEEALSESNCTLEESIVEYGTTGSTVSAEVKTYEGFISPTQQSLTILADGSAEISYFYTRKILTLTLENGEGIASVTGAGSYEFEEEVTINAELQDNYNWAQWTDISSNTAFSQIQNHTFTMVGENLTLRAEAVVNSITIYFDNAGGTGNLQSAVYDYNSALNNIDSTDLPTKTGYNFQGYFTAPNGEGEEIYNANGQTDKYCTFTADTTIYAHWEGKTYTVTYSENLPDGFVGGQYTPISTSVVFGNAYPVLAEFTALPEKTAYNIELSGWALTENGEIITNSTVVNTPSDHTLYAQWEVTPIDYTINFSSGKGYTITAEKDGANFLSGQTANITNTIIFTITALNGYENAQLSASGGSCTFDNNILSNVCDNIQISGSVTLIEYDITYNLRGGNVTPANPATYTIEDTFTLNNPTRYGYDFKGWVYEGQTEPQLEVVVEEGTFGDLEFTANYALTPAIAPVITTQPIGGQTPYGISFGLSVVVSGAEGHILTYQWFKDGELIDGATEDVYTTDNTIPAGEINQYQVIITATREDNDLTATATSNIAEVEITFLDFENVDVSGSYDGIYTGETRSIVVTTATLGATIEYSMDNATWQTEIIEFINATNGPQTIYWQITKANYNTQNGSEIINIVQAPNGWTVTPNIDGWVYGEPNSPSGESTFGEIVFTYSIKDANDFKDEIPTDAGSYTMRAEIVETENFEGLVREVDFTIEQREVTIVWGETSFTYDGTPKIPTATAVGLLNRDVCEVVLSGEQIEVSITPYTATAIGLTNTNYKLPQTGVTIEFYIYYEKISGIEVISYSGIYDKLPHSVVVQGALDNDAIYYSKDNATWQTEPITRINAGITTLYVKVTRTNFADFVSEAAAISISQATLIKPIAITTEFNYNGQLQSYIPNGFDIETMNISNHEQIMANENGYNVLVEIKDKVNYTWEDSTQMDLNFVFVIHKLNPTIITQPTYSSVYSGQKLSDVEIIGGTMTTAGEFSWEHPNTTLINGENDVTLVFSPNDLENCNIKIMQVVVITTQIQLTFDVNDITLGAVTTNELYVDYGTILTINENALYIGSANVIAQTNIIPGVFIDFVDFTNAVVGEITAPLAITANFEIAGIIAEISARNYFSQNTNGVVGGSIVFEGKTVQETTFETNTEIKVLATPEAGYELHHWLVNGDEKTSTALNTLVLTAENEALEIIAVFKGKQVKLNLDGGENADIQDTNGGNKDGEYYHVGDIIEVNALAHTGYIFNNEWIHSNLGEIEGPYYTLTSDDAVSGEITLRAITFSAIIQVDFVINGGGNVFVEADTWNEIAKSYTMSYNSDILASFTATERYAYDYGSIKLDNAEATTLAPYVQSDVISITHDKYNRASKITITLNFKEQKWDDYVLSNMIATLPGNTGYKVIVDFDFNGDGTKEKPYTIESSEQFALLSFVINNQVLQSDNEKLAYNTAKTYFVVEGKYDFSERFWMPIGTAENPFNAVIKFENKPTGIHLTTASQGLIGIGFDEDTIEKYDGLFGYFGADAKVNPNDGKGSFLLYVVIAGVLALIALGIFLSFLFNKKRAERKASKNVMNTSRASQLQDLRNQFKNDYDYDDDD